MHHLYRSRFLIDSLSRLGVSSSYTEVNAACSLAPDVLDSDTNITSLIFAGDNMDHNIITLNGKGTFHGMGMVAAITPGKQANHIISRQKMAEVKLVELTSIDIIDYHSLNNVNREVEFQGLPFYSTCYRTVDIF